RPKWVDSMAGSLNPNDVKCSQLWRTNRGIPLLVEHGKLATTMSAEQSVAGGGCTPCGKLVTHTEALVEGVVRVIDRAGSMQFHARCFELSPTGKWIAQTTAGQTASSARPASN